MTKKLCLLIALFFGLFWERAFASVVLLPEEKVIASVLVSEDVYLSPGAVTVIRPDDYKGEINSLGELLSRAPGVTIVSGMGGVESAMIRGSHQSTVAVYVDGIAMNTTNDRMYYQHLGSVPYAQIERVEVYRGFVPARFGHQAMGGVINIVTKMPTEKETTVQLGGGSFGRFRADVSQSVPIGDGMLFGSVGWESYGGGFDYINKNNPPDYKATRAEEDLKNFNLMLKWYDEHWRFRFNWQNKKYDYPMSAKTYPEPGSSYVLPWYDWTIWEASVGRTQKTGALTWGWDISYRDQSNEFDGDSVGWGKSEFLNKRTTVALRGEMPAGERHLISAVAEYAHEKWEYTGSPGAKFEEFNLNFQNEIILNMAGTFLAVPSLRYNNIDGDGRFTWQLAFLKELPARGLTLKTAYGTYSRLPSPYEKYGDGVWTLPNPDLKPETGEQFDLGLTWRGAVDFLGGANVDVSLTGYWRNSKNLIGYFDYPDYTGQYRNLHKATVKGLEIMTALDWERWNFFLSAGYTDSENKSDDPTLYGRRRDWLPYWDLTARLTRKFDRGSVFVEYQYTGDYYYANYEFGEYSYLMEASNVFSAGIKYDFDSTTSLMAGVKDIFNETSGLRVYDTTNPGWWGTPDYPRAGRTFYLMFNMTF